MTARFKIGDRVLWYDATETVVVAERDSIGAIITVDAEGEYMFRSETGLDPVPPPDPRDAVVEAAVAWAVEWDRRLGGPPDGNHWLRPVYDAAQAYKEANR